jgi:hypothetical protein
MFSIAPETFAFLPPEHSSPIPAAPFFLEQHYEQHGQTKNFRWEIPYQCILRVGESETLPEAATTKPAQQDKSPATAGRELHASAAHASGGASLLSIPQGPKTA